MDPSSPAPIETEIVLVGGGHAHVAVLRAFGMKPQPGVRLTVVARDVFTPYSGMMPGYIAGHYSHAACHIDLGPLCRFAGARLIHGAATGLDPDARRVYVEGRPPLRFDLASLDIGSTTATARIPGAEAHGLPVKPLDRFLERLEAAEQSGLPQGVEIVVAGGGAGGAELALALSHRLRHLSPAITPAITLATSESDLLTSHPPGVRARMRSAMARAGVTVRAGAAVVAVEPDHVQLADGETLPSRLTVLATGAEAAPWLATTGLALDARGFIEVRETLASHSHPHVFATGDIAAFTARPLPKAGVYAVRQGPVLAENLRLAATNRPLRPYRPQQRFLSLLSGGNKYAVASYGPFSAEGAWVWRWKDSIDRRWMQRYQELPQMAEASSNPASPGPNSTETDLAMRCAGCGSKVGGEILARVLAMVDTGSAPGVTLGAGDDAAVLLPPPGLALVQSTDHFRAFTGDAFRFGQIAAQHALSDLYAMGAEPHSALAHATVPIALPGVQEADLLQTLSGACQVLRAAGAALIGGHTAEGPELAFGLTVNGFADPAHLWRKSGARPGDALILTKPLGTGIVLAGDMRGKAQAAWMDAAFASMLQSNGLALPALRSHGARAVTDVTGFGLGGHLAEVMAASGVGADIQTDALPLLPGVEPLLAEAIESSLAPQNRALAPDLPAIFADPQTSGGLLAALPADRAEACLAALRQAGFAKAACIGYCNESGRLAARSGEGLH